MIKFRTSIKKEILIITRDRIGMTLMFIMPIILVIVITSIQNSTFELVNENRISLVIINNDKGELSTKLTESLQSLGSFRIFETQEDSEDVGELLDKHDAMIGLEIPEGFTNDIKEKSSRITDRVMFDFGLNDKKVPTELGSIGPLRLYFNPVFQDNFRFSVHSAIRSVLQLLESQYILENLYTSISGKGIPPELKDELTNKKTAIDEIPISKNGKDIALNATQHNVPAWTIFAMFFIVVSLGGGIVREKLSGSFIRLKTLPTSFLLLLTSKQITYLFVSIIQVIVIFSIGIFLFPMMGLPKLSLPHDILGLLVVALICGLCAISFALCIGVFAQTEEQANGFGAVSVFILAAIGGLLVPSFAMPESFKSAMILSPLYWCLESFHGLFLEGSNLRNLLPNLFPLIGFTVFLQIIAIAGLKRKNLI